MKTTNKRSKYFCLVLFGLHVLTTTINAQEAEIIFPTSLLRGSEVYEDMGISPNGRYAYFSERDQVILWETTSGKQIKNFGFANPHTIKFSLSSRLFMLSEDAKRIAIYETSTGKLVQQIKLDIPGAELGSTMPRGSYFINQDKEVLVIYSDSSVIWDVTTGKKLKSFGKREDFPPEVDFITNGLKAYSFNHINGKWKELDPISIRPYFYPGDLITSSAQDSKKSQLTIGSQYGELIVMKNDSTNNISYLGLPGRFELIQDSLGVILDTLVPDTTINDRQMNEDGSEEEVMRVPYQKDYFEQIYFVDSITLLTKSKRVGSLFTYFSIWDVKQKIKTREVKFPFRESKIYTKGNVLYQVSCDSIYYYKLPDLKLFEKKPIQIETTKPCSFGTRKMHYNSKRNILLIIDNERKPTIINMEDGSVRSKLEEGPQKINSNLYVESGGRKLLLIGYQDFCTAWDIEKAEIVFTDIAPKLSADSKSQYTRSGVELTLTEDKKYIIINYHSTKSNYPTMKIFNLQNFQLVETFKNMREIEVSSKNTIVFEQAQKENIYGYEYKIDSRLLKKIYEDNDKSTILKLSKSGEHLIRIKEDSLIEIFDLSNYQKIAVSKYRSLSRREIENVKISSDEEFFIVEGVQAIDIPVYKLSTGNLMSKFQVSKKGGEMLEWAFFYKNKGVFCSFSSQIFYFDLKTLTKTPLVNFQFMPFQFINDSTFWGRYSIAKEGDPAMINANMHHTNTGLFTIDSKVNIKQIRKYDWVGRGDFQDTMHIINNSDFSVNISFLKNKQPYYLCRVYAAGAESYLFRAGKNYYAATKEVAGVIRFKVGDKIYPFDQFDLKYNRPDSVLTIIGSKDTSLIKLYKKAYEKRLKKSKVSVTTFSDINKLPTVAILNFDNIPDETNNKKLLLKTLSTDRNSRINNIHVKINNVPINFDESQKRLTPDKLQREDEIVILLSHGQNKIQLSCVNEKGFESLKETFYVKYTPKPDSLIKSKTYFIGIAVDKYKQKGYDLNFCRKDIRNLTQLFKRKYPDCIIDTLMDKSATKKNIIRLKQKLMSTNIEDRVIISLSGHGLLNDSLDFFYGTHDIKFSEPEKKGMKYELIESLLTDIPARKKMLLIDACQSGEADKEENLSEIIHHILDNGDSTKRSNQSYINSRTHKSFEFMQKTFADITEGNGSHVMSAAAASQLAQENEEWGNGAFTYAIIQGLNSGNADANSDNNITVTELKTFVTKKVSELTKGDQKPSTRKDNVDNDWIIWSK